MKMKLVTVMLGILVIMFQLLVGDYDKANADLQAFYTEMLSANFSAATLSINRAIELWPDNSRFYSWRAYSRSQRLPSQCPRALGGPGATLSSVDQKAAWGAISDYRVALKLNGRDAVAYHNLAWLEHLLGNDSSADRDWTAAILIDPNNPVFHLNYGMFLEEVGKPEAADLLPEI